MAINNHIFDFYTEVSKGLVPKHRLVHKFGHNLDVDTTTDPETVWARGGLYTFLSAPSTLTVASDNPADISTGTGAHTIIVEGLDANYDEISENFNISGAVPQVGKTIFLRVNRAYVTTAGTNETNIGTITVSATVGGTILATIPRLYGQTQQTVYTVPNNHKAYLTSFSASIAKAVPSTMCVFEMVFRKDGVKRIKQNISIDTTGSTSFVKYFKMPLPVEEKTDIFVNAREVSQNNTGIFSNFALIIVDQSEKYQAIYNT